MLSKIKNRISYIRQHWFVKNLLFFQAGDFAANVTQAIIGIFIVRLLQPESYGLYALAFSLSGFMTVFLGLATPMAATTLLSEAHAQNDRKKMREIFAFLVKMTFVLSLLILIGAIFAPWLGRVFYDNYKIGVYASILLIATAIGSTFYSFTFIALQITRRIRTMTILAFSNQFSRSILALLFIIAGLGAAGAVSGHLVGSVIVFIAAILVWRKISRQDSSIPSIRNLMANFFRAPVKKYLGFSIWITADSNLANLYNILPIMLTGMFVTATEVTFFKLAFGYINLALSLIGPISTLLNVEFPKMKVAEDSRDVLLKNFWKVSKYTLLFSAVLTAGAILVAPLAFRILYGSTFDASVKYVAGLFLYGATMGMGVGFGPMWRAINKVKLSIIINVITLGVGVPIGLLLIKNYGLWGTVLWVTLIFNVSHIASFALIVREIKKLKP